MRSEQEMLKESSPSNVIKKRSNVKPWRKKLHKEKLYVKYKWKELSRNGSPNRSEPLTKERRHMIRYAKNKKKKIS